MEFGSGLLILDGTLVKPINSDTLVVNSTSDKHYNMETILNYLMIM